MTDVTRRETIQILAGIPLLAAGLSPQAVVRGVEAARRARESGAPYTPVFFTAHEYQTVVVLADIIIPRDERSGSATDAGVAEFIDYIVWDQKGMQTPTRGGLAWMDNECQERFGKSFLAATAAQRGAVVDDIAWPKKARPEMSQGVAFFNDFRDLTASGFFSSRMGVTDLQYLGNTVVPEWKGCPPAALEKLGVSYK
jgi:gluconate 2-dehydrogenase gamma chain